MPKQSVLINFAKGLNQKIDPWQLPIGNFETFVNSVFQKFGLFMKRNGYGVLSESTPTSSFVTTLNGNLTSIGTTVNAFSKSLNSWITKGQLQPCSLDVLPLIRNNLNQTQADSVVSNGMVLTVFTQTGPQYLYAIADATTGQNIVEPTAIVPLATGAIQGSSRAFVIGIYFVIVSPVTVSGTTYLQYVSIPTLNPVNVDNTPNVSAPQNVTADNYVPLLANPGWDGITVNDGSNNYLLIAYNTTTGGQGVHVATLTVQQVAVNAASTIIKTFTGATNKAALMSVCLDATQINIFYVSFWNPTNHNVYILSVYTGFGTITQQFAPTIIENGTDIANLASAAQNGGARLFIEHATAYFYDAAIPNHYIEYRNCTQAGVIDSTVYTLVNGLGLASKAFIINDTMYVLGAYQSPFQPSYFLINGSLSIDGAPVVVAKLAYQNGSGYLTLGLPNVTVNGSVAQIAYLFKDLVEALNTLNNTTQTTVGGIYSQLGVNLATFDVETTEIATGEIAQNLHISGGYLAQFDGYLPVEHNFFLFPDSIEAVWSATGGSIAAKPDGTTNTNAYAIQVVYEWTDNQGLPYRSAPSIPIFVTTTGSGTAGSILVSGPTLRLTAKTANPVKIVVYRWSVATQVYNQTTSITAPLLNNTAQQEFAFTDTLADASIVGNNLIYTTGGVVPDANAPSTRIMTLFDGRLWTVDAENPNMVWVSKQVLPGTPIEMSQLFTIFVAPTTGTVNTLGPITAMFPMDDKIIFFFESGICYINGVGPDNLGTTQVGCSLGNYSQPIFITSTVGCTNAKSVVLTPNGLMFQSDKGIWLLTRNLQTTYIGAPVESFNGSVVNSANVIPETNYVLFTLDNNQFLMYDYYFEQWGTFEGVSAVSGCIYQGLHTILDIYGRILQETPGAYVDVDSPVLMRFKTSWINVASLQGYERFYEFYLLAKFLSPHMLGVDVSYDYNSSVLNSVVISPSNFSPSTPGPFGVPAPFGAPGNLEQWRIHAKRQLCQSFQIAVSEIFNVAYGPTPGAGFTMSGITALCNIKKATRPIRGASTGGLT